MGGLDGDLDARTQLNALTLSCWRSLVKVHAIVSREIQADLIERRRLTLGAFEVLVQLSGASGREQRMTDLADAVLLSRSGVTRLVDRLERAELVARQRTSDDGRGVVAVLTEKGLDRLRTAAVTHLDGIVRHFVARLDCEQLTELGRITARLGD